MKYSLSDLSVDDNKKMLYTESIELDMNLFQSVKRLRSLGTLIIDGVWYYDDINDHLYTEFNLSGDMVVSGSLDLKDYDHHFSVDTVEIFAFDQLDDIADHLVYDNEVNLLPIIQQLVVANIPIRIADENLEYPKGKGWEVVSEGDLEMEEAPINPKMAKLLELDIDND